MDMPDLAAAPASMAVGRSRAADPHPAGPTRPAGGGRALASVARAVASPWVTPNGVPAEKGVVQEIRGNRIANVLPRRI
eukprot:6550666-Pyramimonas_sp.AAC.1